MTMSTVYDNSWVSESDYDTKNEQKREAESVTAHANQQVQQLIFTVMIVLEWLLFTIKKFY